MISRLLNLLLLGAVLAFTGCGGGGGGGGGVTDVNAPATVTVSSSSATSFINNAVPVSITANVKKADGTAVANGTPVTFTASGGTLSAATAATTDGNATVTFNSTTAGTFTITATAGSATGNVQVTFTSAPTQAVVKLETSGQLASGTLIGGIQATLTYPTTKGLSITAGDVVLSGVGRGLFAPNVNVTGQVSLGNVDVSPGIPIGEFATATFAIAAGNPQVVAGDFAIAAGASVIDTTSTALPGITVAVRSVTLQ